MTAAWGTVYPMQDNWEDALSVREAELSMLRRIGAIRKEAILGVQGNLANTYRALGRLEEALPCDETYTLDFEAPWRRKWRDPQSSRNYANLLNQSKALQRSEDTAAQNDCPWRDASSESNEFTLK